MGQDVDPVGYSGGRVVLMQAFIRLEPKVLETLRKLPDATDLVLAHLLVRRRLHSLEC